jgi:hypothetical protein
VSTTIGPSELEPTAIVAGGVLDGDGELAACLPLPPGEAAVAPAGAADRLEPLLHAETTKSPAPASKTMEAARRTFVDRDHWDTLMMFSLTWDQNPGDGRTAL